MSQMNQNNSENLENLQNPDSLMSRIPAENFSDLSHDSQIYRVSLARSDRYYHLTEEAQKKSRKTQKKSKSQSQSKSKSSKSQKSQTESAQAALEKLSPEQREKIKKELGIC